MHEHNRRGERIELEGRTVLSSFARPFNNIIPDPHSAIVGSCENPSAIGAEVCGSNARLVFKNNSRLLARALSQNRRIIAARCHNPIAIRAECAAVDRSGMTSEQRSSSLTVKE